LDALRQAALSAGLLSKVNHQEHDAARTSPVDEPRPAMNRTFRRGLGCAEAVSAVAAVARKLRRVHGIRF
jgi:hypothetical protein